VQKEITMRSMLIYAVTGLILAAAGCSSDRAIPDGASAAASGNAAGPGTFVADQTPLEWRFERDGAGRIVRVISPAGRAIGFHFEADKQGQTRRVVKELPDGSKVIHELDAAGLRTSMTDPHGRVAYEHDGFGLLKSVERAGGTGIRYERDVLGRITGLTVGSKKLVYRYDYLGRLSAIDTPAGTIAYTYSPGGGEVTRTLPNQVRTVRKYHPGGRLESIAHYGPDGAIIARYEYSYRPDGKIRATIETSREGKKTTSYEYDAEGRLVVADEPAAGRIEYRHDNLGNRVELVRRGAGPVVSAHDWAGRMLSHDGERCLHDESGNLAGLGTAAGSPSYAHSPEDQLVRVSLRGREVSYRYDGDGHLIGREDQAGMMRFVPDPLAESWKPLLATDSRGVETFYIWGEGGIPLATVEGSRVSFFLQDHLGSVRHVLDRAGAVLESRSYCPFGEPREKLAGGFEPGFAGLFHDATTELIITRFRAYDPRLGRFLERDPEHRIPFGSPDDLSAYVYCTDPVNQVDVTGMSPMPPPFMPPSDFDRLRRATVAASIAQGQIRPPSQSGGIPLGTYIRTFLDGVRDPGYAKQWYADRSAAAMAQGTFTGVLRSTAYDLVGGAVYGEGVTREQRLAGAMWNLVPVVGEATTITGMLYNASQGEAKKGLLDGAQLLLPGARLRAEMYQMRGAAKVLDNADNLVDLVVSGKDVRKELSGGQSSTGIRGNQGPPLRFFQDDRLGPWHFYHDPEGDESDYMPLDRVIASIEAEKSKTETWDALEGIRSSQGRGTTGGNLTGSTLGAPVGGIYLGGASEALKELGALRGIAVDRQGRIVLLSESRGDLSLPPLDLDDLVTIFRGVYTQGAPYVSIDPKPDDPQGKLQLIRHGPGTSGTRVGWVLFECDRLMKSYSVGVDNITGMPVQSRIPGHREILDLGFAPSGRNNAWERFWIICSRVERSHPGKLTLFDVPLDVKTQAMVLRSGKLVPAPNGTSSRMAKAFSPWFARNLDEVDGEAIPAIPDGNQVDPGTRVFSELRRIALMAAMAELLRDQGVPLPAWMRTYQVKPFHMPETTPAVVSERTKAVRNGTVTQRIYGGVSLDRSEGKGIVDRAPTPAEEALAVAALEAIETSPPLEAVTIQSGGSAFRVLALPTDSTTALGACRLREVDLVVKDEGAEEAALSLVRHHSSFHRPTDLFGPGWTLDLPYLARELVPIERKGNMVRSRVDFHLASPLGTVTGKVDVAEGRVAALGSPSHVLVAANGERLHFDQESGVLLAQEGPQRDVIYRRNADGRLESIESWSRGEKRAEIRLVYGPEGRLQIARGSDGRQIHYGYDSAGLLVSVADSGEEKRRYEYRDGLVVRVRSSGRPDVAYGYNRRGQLESVEAGDTLTNLRLARSESGSETLTLDLGKVDGETLELTAYSNGSRGLTVEHEGGATDRFARSADGESTSWHTATGGTYLLRASLASGRDRQELIRDGAPLLQMTTHADGRLDSIQVGADIEVRPVYRGDGRTGEVVLAPTAQGGTDPPRLRILLDSEGGLRSLVETSARSTSEVAAELDPSRKSLKIARGDESVILVADDAGGLSEIRTSWGTVLRRLPETSRGSTPQGVELTVEEPWDDAKRARVILTGGMPVSLTGFDGEEHRFEYQTNPRSGMLASIRTPEGNRITYEVGPTGLISDVGCSPFRLSYRYDAGGRLVGLTQSPSSISR
jgi:RHS repeat-associated protein